jgi:predicted nucleotidyltransferase
MREYHRSRDAGASMNDINEPTMSLSALAKRYGIRLIVQFGSTVSGPVHERSDVDIGVLFSNADLDLYTLSEVRQGLQAFFPDREVDLAVINRADPLFLKKLMERARLLHGLPQDLQRLRLYAFKRFQDHRRFLELERRYVARELARHRVAL